VLPVSWLPEPFFCFNCAQGVLLASRTMRRLRSAWVVSGASIREQINLIGGKSQALFYVAEK